MPIELTPPTIYGTPGELADAYMSEVERAWRERPAFDLDVELWPPAQVGRRVSVDGARFWQQVELRLPEGWALRVSTDAQGVLVRLVHDARIPPRAVLPDTWSS